MRNLIIAWVTTIVLLGTGVIWAEMTYVPPPEPIPDPPVSFDADGNLLDNSQNDGIDNGIIGEDTQTMGDQIPTQTTASEPSLAEKDQNPTLQDTLEDKTDAIMPGDNSPAGEVIEPTEGGFKNNYIIAAGDPELTEQGPYGNLPITWNQRQPWQVYSRPFEKQGDRPKIAIIISNIGLNARMTQAAIDELPPEISFALSPYGQGLKGWTEGIRKSGHEMLLMVPMEPLDYPLNDPGPQTLMTSLSENENLDRLYWVLARTNGYVGIINEMGSKFTADPEAIRPLMQDIQRRGIAFVDSRTTRFTLGATSAKEFGIPTAINSRYIDNDLSGAQIDRYLRELENTAQRSGYAVGIGRTNPVTYRRIIEWALTLESKGIDLAPITAVINKQETR